MIIPDVNVLVLAHRQDSDQHQFMRSWLEEEVNSDRPFALADIAVAGFLRVVTNPKVYQRPSTLEVAIDFVDGLVEESTCVPVAAGPRHWEIMRRVIRDGDARANMIPDAHLGAIAIEQGGTIATLDRGFARFPDVRWLDPLVAPHSGRAADPSR